MSFRSTSLAVLVLLASRATAVPLPVQKIAIAGESAPGVPGQSFGVSLGAQVNDDGQVAISARVGAASNISGIWMWNATDGAPRCRSRSRGLHRALPLACS